MRAWWRRRWARVLLAALALAVAAGLALSLGAASGGAIVRDERGCPRSVGAMGSVSWVEAVHVDGAMYEGLYHGAEAPVDPALIGPRVGVVRCRTGDAVQHPEYALRDGEATFLPEGTPLHELGGTEPGFRVVAMTEAGPRVYQQRGRQGARGADLLPVAARDVRAVEFLSPADGVEILGRVTEPAEVASFVMALQEAPVGPVDPGALGEDPRVFIALELAGQPPLILVAYPGHGVTTDGIRLPRSVLARLPEAR